MIVIVTANKIESEKIHDSNIDFIISALYADRKDIMKDAVSYYAGERFDIYHKFGMDVSDIEEEYIDNKAEDDNDEYYLHPKTYISEIIDELINNITSLEEHDPKVIIAIEGAIGRQMTSALTKAFNSKSIEVAPINLFQYYKITSMDYLVKSLKMSLNTNFIYPEDPIFMGYAIYRMIMK